MNEAEKMFTEAYKVAKRLQIIKQEVEKQGITGLSFNDLIYIDAMFQKSSITKGDKK